MSSRGAGSESGPNGLEGSGSSASLGGKHWRTGWASQSGGSTRLRQPTRRSIWTRSSSSNSTTRMVGGTHLSLTSVAFLMVYWPSAELYSSVRPRRRKARSNSASLCLDTFSLRAHRCALASQGRGPDSCTAPQRDSKQRKCVMDKRVRRLDTDDNKGNNFFLCSAGTAHGASSSSAILLEANILAATNIPSTTTKRNSKPRRRLHDRQRRRKVVIIELNNDKENNNITISAVGALTSHRRKYLPVFVFYHINHNLVETFILASLLRTKLSKNFRNAANHDTTLRNLYYTRTIFPP